jgi:hypothetical protein
MFGTAKTGGDRLTPLRQAIFTLALATAIIHIFLAMPLTLVAFYLNGLGYAALAAALVLPSLARYQRLIRWVLLGYTAMTILLWVAFGQPYTAIGYIDKAIELALLGLLWLDHRQSAASSATS